MLIAIYIVLLVVFVDAATTVTATYVLQDAPRSSADKINSIFRMRRHQAFALAVLCMAAIVALQVWA